MLHDGFDLFVFSGRGEPPREGFFSGYAFVGSDYIAGKEGHGLYADATGRNIRGGEDGCYAVAWRDGDSWIFESDYGGLCTILYYDDGEDWVVSNSFNCLLDHLAELGKPPKPHYPSLAATSRSIAFKQYTSYKTPGRGVYLLPMHSKLSIGGGDRAKVFGQEPYPAPASTYEQLVAQHVTKWMGRFYTLLCDPEITFQVDLSGGRDSRSNFGMLLAARKIAKDAGEHFEDPRVHCGAIAGDPSDLEAASRITDHYRIEINPPDRYNSKTLSDPERYRSWKMLSLGAYSPVYFPRRNRDYTVVEIGGGGAPNHRRTIESQIKSDDYEYFIRRSSKKLENHLFAQEFVADQYDLFGFYRSLGVPKGELLTEWYRQFRGRIHNGRPSRYGVHFQPFVSRELDQARAVAGSERLATGQFNFDIMAATVPELLHFPYDKESKKPSQQALDQLVSVRVNDCQRTGRVWTGPRRVPNVASKFGSGMKPGPSPVECLAYDLEEALKDPFVRDFYSAERLEMARRTMGETLERGKFHHALEGAWISPLIVAHAVSPRRSW